MCTRVCVSPRRRHLEIIKIPVEQRPLRCSKTTPSSFNEFCYSTFSFVFFFLFYQKDFHFKLSSLNLEQTSMSRYR